MTLRVTFDTNTFDKVVRPSVYAGDPHYSECVAIHEALKRGDVLGFISETIIEAKQSMPPREERMDCFVASASRSDDQVFQRRQ